MNYLSKKIIKKIKNEEFFRLGSCDCEGNYRPVISAPYICLRDAKKQKSL